MHQAQCTALSEGNDDLAPEQLIEENEKSKPRRIEGAIKPWDLLSFSRVGDLRNDCDLEKAGVNTEDSVAVGKSV
jgi:hypothetical protein